MNTGDTTFILFCSTLVFFMTPGLAFFYGGLVRRKNVLNTMMSSLFIMGLSSALWILVGYSLSFSGDHGHIIGDFTNAFLRGIGMNDLSQYSETIPALVFVGFQMMFAIITPALITGSVAGRMRSRISSYLYCCGFLLYTIHWLTWYGAKVDSLGKYLAL